MKHEITVCLGCCCPQKGGIAVYAALRRLAHERNDFHVSISGCMGPCDSGPNVVVNGKLFTYVKSSDLPIIIEQELPRHQEQIAL